MDFLVRDPPRVFLVNLTSNERWDALFNPELLTERLEVKFNRSEISGLSHERLQYKNTGNKVIPLEFYLSQLAQDERAGVSPRRSLWPDLMSDRAFLESLAYPAENTDYQYQGTPRVLFVWPAVIRMVGRITSLEFEHRQFSVRDLKTTILVARVDFEEDRDMRLLMNEVREYGGQREDVAAPDDDVEEGGG